MVHQGLQTYCQHMLGIVEDGLIIPETNGRYLLQGQIHGLTDSHGDAMHLHLFHATAHRRHPCAPAFCCGMKHAWGERRVDVVVLKGSPLDTL